MSISIVTVTYNSSNHIAKFLRSIDKECKYLPGCEVIILDNNSSDKLILKKIISSIKFKHTKCKIYLRKKNYGFAKSCNYGARMTKNDHILFLNPDTEMTNKSLITILDHMRINNAQVAGGMAVKHDPNLIHRTVFRKVGIRSMLFEFSNLGKILKIGSNFYYPQLKMRSDVSVDGVGGGYLMIEKNTFHNLNGFDENFFMYLEDIDLCHRVKEGGGKVIYCPHSIIFHIGGASSDNLYRIMHDSWYNSREYYAKKHFPKILGLILIYLYKIERVLLEIRESMS